jgi:hypothetical protein
MSETRLALRQADQARTDFAIVETELEALHPRLARMPTRADLARTALGIMFCSAVLVIAWFEVFGGTACGPEALTISAATLLGTASRPSRRSRLHRTISVVRLWDCRGLA